MKPDASRVAQARSCLLMLSRDVATETRTLKTTARRVPWHDISTNRDIIISVDRFFEARFPGLSFSHIQRIVRKGELRVNDTHLTEKDQARISGGGPLRLAASGDNTSFVLIDVPLQN